MNEILKFNIQTRQYEVLTDNQTVSFKTEQGRFDVKFDDSGGIEIYHMGNYCHHDQIVVIPKAQNVILVTGEKRNV